MLRVGEIDRAGGRQAFPSGGLLRPLLAGGARSIRGLGALHRKFYHASVQTMGRLCKLAGVNDSVIKEIPGVVEQCKVCRTWERPQVKPFARSEFEIETNKRVYCDVIHYMAQGQILMLVFHMTDGASRYKMLELLPDKSFLSFRKALSQWFRVFDPPGKLVTAQESAMS